MGFTPNLGQGTPANGTTPPAGSPNINFGAVGGGDASQQVISTIYDYNPFAVLRKVHERHNERNTLRMLWKAFGWSRGVNAPTTGHYESEWKDSLVKLGTVDTAALGAGNDIIMNLHADMMYDASQTVNGAARQASYPLVGEVIRFIDGNSARIKAKDTSTSPHKLTLTPLKSTVDLDTSITPNTEYFIATNMHGEGSNLPGGRISRVLKYTNEFQIIKEACGATGSELTNETFVQHVDMGNGSIFVKFKADMFFRYEKRVGGAFLWGQSSDNITEFNSELGFDIQAKGTEGLVEFIETSGYEDTYTLGSYAEDDLYVIGGIYESEQAGTRTIMTLDGYDIFVETEKAFATFFANDFSPALMKSIGERMQIGTDDMQPFLSSDFDFYIGFKGARIGGYNFHFTLVSELNEAIGAGAAGYKWTNSRFFLPYGEIANKNGGGKVPYVGYEYKQLGSYKREAVIADFGGAGVAGYGGILDVPVDGWDRRKVGVVGEYAGHYSCPNLMVLQKPA